MTGVAEEEQNAAGKLRVAWGCPFFTVKRPSGLTQTGTPYGVGVHVDETGVAEEDVIGKEGLQETMLPIEDMEGTEYNGQALSCWGVPFFGEEAC